jgi:hypothetical protein
MAVVLPPLHRVWLAGCVTVGIGFTEIVKLACVLHPALVAVTAIVEVIADEFVLAAVNKGIGLKLPLACE